MISLPVPLSFEQLRCVAKASLDTAYFNEFENTPAQTAYNSIYDAERRNWNYRAAVAWLSKRHLLVSLPRYSPQREGLHSYARRLERFCAVQAGAGLRVAAPQLLSPVLDPRRSTLSDKKFTCLMMAIAGSNLRDYGIGYGFIANAFRPDNL